MKKLVLFLAILLIPCTAFGLEMMSDNALDNVTGQSGVAIAADDIQIFLNVEKFAYIDCDGYDSEWNYGGTCTSTLGAAFTVSNFQMDTININMIGGRGSSAATLTSDLRGVGEGIAGQSAGHQTSNGRALAGSSCGQITLFYDYGTNASYGCNLRGNGQTLGLENYNNTNPYQTISGFNAKALTIDITSSLPLMTAGWQGDHYLVSGSTNTIAGVVIGLPTMEIYIHNMTMTPALTADLNYITTAQSTNVRNNNASFGTIVMNGITFTLLNGWVEIAPTGTK